MAIIFQTTFDFADWDQVADGISDAAIGTAGDGISGNGSWTTSSGNGDFINAAGNNAAGGGGKGLRHSTGDGNNNGGGGITIEFASSPEVWIRYYIRYPAGFAWGGSRFHKQIYVQLGGSGTFYFGLHAGSIGGHAENDNVDYGDGAGNHIGSLSWSDMMGGSTGDGQWHCVEVHLKQNTLSGNSDGVIEFWWDGVQVYSRTGVHFSNVDGGTYTNFKLAENHNAPSNGGDVFVDFDDVAVDDAAYIGPLSAGGSSPVWGSSLGGLG